MGEIADYQDCRLVVVKGEGGAKGGARAKGEQGKRRTRKGIEDRESK
jgi:hypothetical protein